MLQSDPINLIPADGRQAVERLIRRLGWTLVALGGAGLAVWWAGGEWLVREWLGADLSRAPALIRLHASLDPEVRDLDYFLAMALPAGTRLFALTGLAGVVLARSRWSIALARLFERKADCRDLAFFRVVVFLSLAAYTQPAEIGRFADLPPDLLLAPVGWGWLLGFMPLSSVWAVPLAWLLIGASLAAAVGFRPRVTSWLAVGLGVVVLGIPQFYGKINHFHHLIWFTAIVAASPAWDVWSLGAWRTQASGAVSPTGQRTGSASCGLHYGRPLVWVWLLIGLIYFFPGLWKAAVDAAAWMDGSAMATMLHAQWFRMDAVPPIRVDLGGLSMLAGSAVLVFEIGFIFALASPSSRAVFVLGAALFHLGVFLLAGINFWSLAVCLVAFIPVGYLVDRLRGVPPEGAAPAPPPAAGRHPDLRVNRLGAVLVGLMLMAGLTGLDTWPVAVYPTFAGIPDHLYATLMLETSDGERIDPYRSGGLRSAFGQSRIMGLAWQLGRVGEDSKGRARSVLEAFAPFDSRLVPGDSVDVLVVHLDIRPESRREIRSIRLGRFAVGDGSPGVSPQLQR
ncbi:MAG: hypothetical protein ACI9W4_001687 [Rhodothermales bacterium]|jgi:hypothetical protein